MAKKIPMTTLDASNVSTSITQAPVEQYAEFTEYRETMAAYCKARVWFADAVASPAAEPPIKFWFANSARRSIFASLMHDWYAGYWPTRHDLFVSSRGVGESTFGRILKEAVGAELMIIDTDEDDGRSKIIKPTRQSILSMERLTTAFFVVLRDANHPGSDGYRAIDARVAALSACMSSRVESGFSME